MTTHRLALLALAFAAESALAQAPAPAPAPAPRPARPPASAARPAPPPANATKPELIGRMIQLQQGLALAVARGLVDQPLMQLQQQAAIAIQQRFPPEQREAAMKDVQAEVRKYGEDVSPIMRDALQRLAAPALGAALDEKFTEEELRQLIVVLESPVLRKYEQAVPDFHRLLTEKIVADVRGRFFERAKVLEAAVRKRIEAGPAPAASAPEPAPRKAVSDAGAVGDLATYRQRIDALDAQLLVLLNQRAELALAVGELKKHEGSVVFRPEREAQVIDGLKARNPGPLKNESVAPIWREIMSACRALESPTRVAFLGPAGTFSEEAALGYFGSSIARVACANFDEVMHATLSGAADFGVIPVENSTEGVVTRALDLFLTTQLFIIGETSLFVRHNLLRKHDSLDGIASVCAHPQALAQCHNWLSNHLPKAERKPVASNAEGARLAAQDASIAAIASSRAASEFGLHVLAPAIQDEAHNRTRFAVLAHPDRHPAPKASGHDCTSIVVSVDNRPGAVHDMLVPLKTYGVSMTRFESRPARSGQWEYYFYIDLVGHPDEAHIAAALRGLREVCAFFKILGTYPVDVH